MVPRAADEPGFSAKSGLMTAEKHAIALAAARLVRAGSTIGISAGTTTYELARAIRDVPHLTVVTNSVPVAQLLHDVWGPGYERHAQYLRVHVAALRRKLEPVPAAPQHLVTETGFGYRLRRSPDAG